MPIKKKVYAATKEKITNGIITSHKSEQDFYNKLFQNCDNVALRIRYNMLNTFIKCLKSKKMSMQKNYLEQNNRMLWLYINKKNLNINKLNTENDPKNVIADYLSHFFSNVVKNLACWITLSGNARY